MHLQLFLVRLESMAFGYLLSQPFGMLVTFSSLNGNLSVSIPITIFRYVE